MEWYVVRKRSDDALAHRVAPSRSRLAVTLTVLFVVLACLALAGYAWAKKGVTLKCDGRTMPVTTFQFTVGGLLQAEQIRLGPKDLVVPGTETRLRDGMEIKVVRAVKVEVTADGKTHTSLTRARTVEEFLKEEKITLGKEDIVTPSLESLLSKENTVKVVRVTKKIEEKQVNIPYATDRKPTTALPKGQTKVSTAGKNGTQTERWEITYHDGKEKERRLMERKVVKQPVNRVVLVGITQTVSRGGEDLRYSRMIIMRATAYTYTGRNTASGIAPHYGVAAVDPGVIKFGTRLYVEGYGYALACDRGSSIKGDRIDLFYPSRGEAMAWGVRTTRVYILE
ncbi:MAG: ubiquitin-like domain-containing protein [Bacillota bacterium]